METRDGEIKTIARENKKKTRSTHHMLAKNSATCILSHINF